MTKTDELSRAQQICRAVCVRHALARFLRIPPEQFDDWESIQDSALVSELPITLNALVGDGPDLPHFSEDQRQLLSIALQLSEQEILYLLERAADKADEPDPARV